MPAKNHPFGGPSLLSSQAVSIQNGSARGPGGGPDRALIFSQFVSRLRATFPNRLVFYLKDETGVTCEVSPASGRLVDFPLDEWGVAIWHAQGSAVSRIVWFSAEERAANSDAQLALIIEVVRNELKKIEAPVTDSNSGAGELAVVTFCHPYSLPVPVGSVVKLLRLERGYWDVEFHGKIYTIFKHCLSRQETASRK